MTGFVHFSGGYLLMGEGLPVHFVYSFKSTENFLYSRRLRKLSPILNILTILHPYVWLSLLVSLMALSWAFLLIYRVYKNSIPHAKLSCPNNDRDNFEFFLLTFASVTEPDPLPWFTPRAYAGKLLVAVWVLSILIVNMAFNSNLRATLLRPNLERPINSMEDVLDRGENLWAAHEYPDPKRKDLIAQVFLEEVASPSVKGYIESNGMTTFGWVNEPVFMPPHVLNDIFENGASMVYYVRLFHFCNALVCSNK